MCATGLCQRMISGTMFGMRLGLASSFSYSAGLRFKASTPPLIELRVVSLPPTIKSRMLPRYSFGGMLRVLSPLASVEIKSSPGALTRSFHTASKYSQHFHSSWKPSATDS